MSSDSRTGTSDRGLAILLALSAAVLVVHLLTGGRYGFHRDELATLDDARHLAWGYIAYPAGDPVLRVDIAEVVWNVADWIPVLRGSFDFGRDSFDRI
jgi:hypothetical protein